jgi:ubiquinone/menaquinone biosynthesis C-methylase UbiE
MNVDREWVERQYASSNPLKVRLETHQRYEERHLDLDELALEHLWLDGNETILDAGCGPGRFLLHLRRAGHRGRLVGFDVSPAMLDELRDEAERDGVQVEGIVGDIQTLPFDDGEFDRVVARHMLYHVPDVVTALREMRRVCRPGGMLLLSTNSQRSQPLIVELLTDLAMAFEIPWEGQPAAFFGIENAAEFLRDAGFDYEVEVYSNALVFTEPEPIVAYCASTFASLDEPPDSTRLPAMERWLLDETTRRLDALGGTWRDPKDFAFFRIAAG